MGSYRIIFFALALLLSPLTSLQAQTMDWLTHAKQSPSDVIIHAITSENQNRVLVGEFQYSTGLNDSTFITNGGTDIFIERVDQNGLSKWSRHFGGTGHDVALTVMYANGAMYVGGAFSNSIKFDSTFTSAGQRDGFIICLDQLNGEVLWSKQIGGAGDDVVTCIAISGSSVFATGKFSGTAQLFDGPNVIADTLVSQGQQDLFVVSYTTAGLFSWKTSGGGAGDDGATAIITDGSSNCLLSGYFSQAAVFGNDTINSRGVKDGLLCRISTSGAWTDATGFGSTGNDSCTALALTSTAIGLSGHFTDTVFWGTDTLINKGQTDGFLLTCDRTGFAPLWSKSIGSDFSDGLNSVSVDNAGSFYTAGFFSDTARISGSSQQVISSGMKDVVFMKFSASGILQWTKRIGYRYDEIAYDIFTALNETDSYIAMEYTDTIRPQLQFQPDITHINGRGGCIFYAANNDGDNDLFLVMKNTSVMTIYDMAKKDNYLYTTGCINGLLYIDSTEIKAYRRSAYIMKFDTSGQLIWHKVFRTYRSTLTNTYWLSFGESIDLDNAGNMILTGHFKGSLRDSSFQMNCTQPVSILQEIFLMKLDSAGHVLWAKTGTAASTSFTGMDFTTTDDIIYTMRYDGALTFDLYGPNYCAGIEGSFIHRKDDGSAVVHSLYDICSPQFQSTVDDLRFLDVERDQSGNLYLFGRYNNDCPNLGLPNVTGISDGNYFVAKYDSNFTPVWARALPCTQIAQINQDLPILDNKEIRYDGQGHLYISGPFGGQIRIGNDSMVASGSFLNNFGPVSFFLAKIDTSGNFIWAKKLSDVPVVNDLFADHQGGICFTIGSLGPFTVGNETIANNITSDWFIRVDPGGDFDRAFRITQAAGAFKMELDSTLLYFAGNIGAPYGRVDTTLVPVYEGIFNTIGYVSRWDIPFCPDALFNAPDTICLGDTAAIINTSSGTNSSYSWHINGQYTSSALHLAFVPTQTGTYSIMLVTSAPPNCADTVIKTIYVNADTVFAAFTGTATNLNATFTNQSTNGLSYLWDFGDATTSTVQNPAHSYSSSGIYNVCLIAYGRCENDTFCTLVNITNIGMQELYYGSGDYTIWPNPGSGHFYLTRTTGTGSQIIRCRLFDLPGKVIDLDPVPVSGNRWELRTPELASGTYFLQISDDSAATVLRVIIR